MQLFHYYTWKYELTVSCKDYDSSFTIVDWSRWILSALIDIRIMHLPLCYIFFSHYGHLWMFRSFYKIWCCFLSTRLRSKCILRWLSVSLFKSSFDSPCFHIFENHGCKNYFFLKHNVLFINAVSLKVPKRSGVMKFIWSFKYNSIFRPTDMGSEFEKKKISKYFSNILLTEQFNNSTCIMHVLLPKFLCITLWEQYLLAL